MLRERTMNCKEYQQMIYLSSEIPERDRDNLREHMKGCKACRDLFESVGEIGQLTAAVSAREIRPSDASRLTRKIMEAISTGHQPGLWEQIVTRLQGGIVRYAFGAVSALLIVMFAYESYPGKRQPQSKEPLAVARVLLSSSVWRERLAARKERKALCSSPSLSASARLLCLKNEWIASKQ